MFVFYRLFYNTYNFFALYANIDGFTYAEKDVPADERPEIDRWILSELNTLIGTVDDAYNNYEPTRAGRAIVEFVNVNDLKNNGVLLKGKKILIRKNPFKLPIKK